MPFYIWAGSDTLPSEFYILFVLILWVETLPLNSGTIMPEHMGNVEKKMN